MVSEEIIFSQYESAKDKFPKLNQPERVGEYWEINGCIDVIDDEDNYWDTFKVKIVVPKKFPEELFELQETGGKIPKHESWHNSNSCCLSTTALIYSGLGEDVTLLNWLVKFAHPFLANYIVKKETGSYAAGDFNHSTDGTIQGYEKLFGVTGAKEVFQKLKMLCSVLQRGRNEKCFCGCVKKFKNCFLQSPFTHKYSGVPFLVLQNDLATIKSYCKF